MSSKIWTQDSRAALQGPQLSSSGTDARKSVEMTGVLFGAFCTGQGLGSGDLDVTFSAVRTFSGSWRLLQLNFFSWTR